MIEVVQVLRPSKMKETAKVHQAPFREERDPRDPAETGSDDPEGAGKSGVRPEDAQSRSAAQHCSPSFGS